MHEVVYYSSGSRVAVGVCVCLPTCIYGYQKPVDVHGVMST